MELMPKKLFPGWYPINSIGRIMAATYVCIPVYVATSQWLGVFPPGLSVPVVGGMSVVMVCAAVSRQRNARLFSREPHGLFGFTLVELLVVISIIGILATIIFPFVVNARKAAYVARAKAELRNIGMAVERYSIDNGGYPADANRNLPPGLEAYLAPGVWPAAPWPGSVYDWDNWAPSDLTHNPKIQTYQVSIRFCTNPGNCQFPNEPWAENFDYYSAVYYCISGSCRAHSSRQTSHAGYCVNC